MRVDTEDIAVVRVVFQKVTMTQEKNTGEVCSAAVVEVAKLVCVN